MLGVRVGEQGQVPGTLDGPRQLALVPGAGAGLPAAADLALIGHVPLQGVEVLIVNLLDLVDAEGADAPAREEAPLRAPTTTATPSISTSIVATRISALASVAAIFSQF